jgi:hypothetical protein
MTAATVVSAARITAIVTVILRTATFAIPAEFIRTTIAEIFAAVIAG